jgi:hypothetical protein
MEKLDRIELDAVIEYCGREDVVTSVTLDEFWEEAEEWLGQVSGLFYGENLLALIGANDVPRDDIPIKLYKFTDNKIVTFERVKEGGNKIKIYYKHDIIRVSFHTESKDLEIHFRDGDDIKISTQKEKELKELLGERLEEIFLKHYSNT